MISARFVPVVFGFVLSALMSFVVSGIATVRTAGLADGIISLWLGAWLASWLAAFPIVLVVAPVARKIVQGMVRAPQTDRP